MDMVVRAADGTETVTGSFVGPDVFDDPWSKAVVPHLQRVSPDGATLATYDVAKQRITLRSTRDLKAPPRTLRVRGVKDAPNQFRYLADGAGFVVATAKDVYLLRLDDPQKLARAASIFTRQRKANIDDIWDTRIHPDGVLIRFEEPEAETYDSDMLVAFATVRGGRLVAFHDIPHSLPEARLSGSTVLSAGRILVAETDHNRGRTWIRTLQHRDGKLVETARQDCHKEDCYGISNWSPDAKRLAYSLHDGSIFVEGAKREMVELAPDDSHDNWYQIDTLWLNPAEDRVVATSNQRLTVWDTTGKRRWSFVQDVPTRIESAKFGPDGKTIWAAIGTKIVRLDEHGKATTALHRSDLDPKGVVEVQKVLDFDTLDEIPVAAVFLDDVIPLPGGAVAYSVVRLKRHIATEADHKRLGNTALFP